MAQLTTNGLRAAWRGQDRWLSDGGPRGGGRLVAKLAREGVALYFQHFAPGGRKRFLPLGPYDPEGVRGLSLTTARDRAAELSRLYRDGTTDLHTHFEREREAAERARVAADQAAQREQDAAKRSTLRQLLDAYASHLERAGKQSVRDVRSIFETHVYEAAPDLAQRKAADLTVDDFVSRIGKVAEAGKGRTAAKLRSYLRAAYSLAIRSKTDPSAPLSMRAFGVQVNPLASVAALSQFSRPRDRVLSAPELGAFLKHLDALSPGEQRDALQLLLLLGGQRPMQLLRITPGDVDLAAATVTLRDAKGARTQPRLHVLPLVKDAAAILERRLEDIEGDTPVFGALRHETLSALVTDISEAMVKAKEAREAFQLRDLRRTAETMLAALKVSSDVRAQLQSHGLGGVQVRHYDRHSYALEKKQALEKWARHLVKLKSDEAPATVTDIGAPRRTGARK